VEAVGVWYEDARPSPELAAIAGLSVPGMFYLPFDGLMKAALAAANRPFREVNRLCGEPGAMAPAAVGGAGGAAPVLLVHVRGTPEAHKSLVLTESELEGLWERIPAAVAGEVLEFVRQPFRSLVFLGCSPRDPLVHRLARLLDVDPSASQGPCFFVSTSANEADDRYWRPFRVEWIRAEPAAVVQALAGSAR
jgi:hypothetical protein